MDRILHVIDGAEVPSLSGEVFGVENPASGQVYGQASFGRVEDVNAAVKSGWDAFDEGTWRKMGGVGRRAILSRIARLVEDRVDTLADAESLDTGKPLAQARGEVALTATLFDYYAGLAEEPVGSVYSQPAGYFAYSRREPYGVVGAISPWNYPFLLAAWKTVPALVAGNSVVLKMAEQTPASSTLLAMLCLEGGLPPGVLNVVHGDGPTAGAALAGHPDVPKITFTGSTETGRAILHAAADHVKSVHLELGGKTPNIVLDDANVDQALNGSVFTSFYNSGQICTSGSRLLVSNGIAEQFTEKLAKRAAGILVGDPRDSNTHLGPLISSAQYTRVTDYIRTGLEEGATRVLGDDHPESAVGGYFVNPTVFENVKPDMRIAQEEIFGPVLSVLRFESDDEAIALANDVMYGLAATVWTTDLRRAFKMADRLDAGIIWTNCPNYLTWNVPYEGHKASGIGEDLGKEALATFTQLKVNYVAYEDQSIGWA